MVKPLFKTGIGAIALISLSACINQQGPMHASHGSKPCRLPDTLTCEKFADDNYRCTCQKGDNLRDILDSTGIPDY